jgi:hypothetical protein
MDARDKVWRLSFISSVEPNHSLFIAIS